MSRSTFDVRDDFVGDGVADEFEFGFKIEALEQLLVLVYNEDNELVQEVRGDDTTFLDSVDYDAANGGGTITLKDPLTEDYRMVIFLANDEPTQPYQFKTQTRINLAMLERALDFLGGAIQRVMYLAKRGVTQHPLQEDDDGVDLTFPLLAEDGSDDDKVLAIADGGLSLKLGPTTASIFEAAVSAEEAKDAAEAAETAAAASQAAALASQNAAAASQAAAEAAAQAAEDALAGAGDLVPDIQGSRSAPILITAAGGIVFSGTRRHTVMFIAGDGAPIDISANPQISDGEDVGQILDLIGCDDTNTVRIQNGNGVILKEGSDDVYHFATSSSRYTWDGVTWTQL